MKPYQRINHFPGMRVITRKDELAKNLNIMRQIMPKEYNFYPLTWVLPRDYGKLKGVMQRTKAKTFIVKPEASC